jgi:hypothetical protein
MNLSPLYPRPETIRPVEFVAHIDGVDVWIDIWIYTKPCPTLPFLCISDRGGSLVRP